MTGARVYLDDNATSFLRPEARAAMIAAMDVVGNPSSVHAEGRAARALLEAARAELAAALGCKPVEVVFTSGATEAAQLLSRLGGEVEIEATAHDALWSQAAEGADGMIPARRGDVAATYAMGLANSETGIVTEPPSRDAAGLIRTGRIEARLLFLDVTQAVGRLPFSFAWSGADVAVLSAHKMGGPKGVGALILRDGLDAGALSLGGGQEMGRRAGTENLIGIAGFAAAATAAMRDLAEGRWETVSQFRNILESALEAESPETIFVGNDAVRLPNTSCLITPGWKGETQVMAMDLAGFAISAGSACSSGKVRESRVLRAMGYDGVQAASAVRVSLGLETTRDEVLRFAEAWSDKRRKQRLRAA
ncbi:MAG: aminotransferase class V-fold PLP-dependent enzyme [Rubellimicrobium sp.]|nr:aminotransferase class V-fold PLP-dependent enzyme [Rubellimicrobium sp.]